MPANIGAESIDLEENCEMKTFEEIMEFRNTNNKFARHINIRTTAMELGYAEGEMAIEEQFGNAINSIHGGCVFSLADTISGSAVSSHGHRMTTLSSSFHYLSPAMNTKKLYAKAREIKHGKSIAVCDVEVFDDRKKLIAKGTFTFYDLDNRA